MLSASFASSGGSSQDAQTRTGQCTGRGLTMWSLEAKLYKISLKGCRRQRWMRWWLPGPQLKDSSFWGRWPCLPLAACHRPKIWLGFFRAGCFLDRKETKLFASSAYLQFSWKLRLCLVKKMMNSRKLLKQFCKKQRSFKKKFRGETVEKFKCYITFIMWA